MYSKNTKKVISSRLLQKELKGVHTSANQCEKLSWTDHVIKLVKLGLEENDLN